MKITLTLIALALLSGCADMVTELAGGSIPISMKPTAGSPSQQKEQRKLPLEDAMYNPERDMTHCYYGVSAFQVVTLEGKVTCPEFQLL